MLAAAAAHSDPSSARSDRAESSEAPFSFHLPSGEECALCGVCRDTELSQDVIHPTASTEGCRLSREPSQPRIGKCNCGAWGGKDVETTTDLSTKPSISPPPGGQAFPGQSPHSAQRRSKAGQETCCGGAFSHGTEPYSPSLGIPRQRGRAPWKRRPGSTVSSPSADISQGKHAARKRSRLQTHAPRASPHWSGNIGQRFAFGFFGYWLSLLEKKGKCQGLCHAYFFIFI